MLAHLTYSNLSVIMSFMSPEIGENDINTAIRNEIERFFAHETNDWGRRYVYASFGAEYKPDSGSFTIIGREDPITVYGNTFDVRAIANNYFITLTDTPALIDSIRADSALPHQYRVRILEIANQFNQEQINKYLEQGGKLEDLPPVNLPDEPEIPEPLVVRIKRSKANDQLFLL